MQLKLGIAKITISDDDHATIVVPKKALGRFTTLIASSGGIGAVIATAVQGGF